MLLLMRRDIRLLLDDDWLIGPRATPCRPSPPVIGPRDQTLSRNARTVQADWPHRERPLTKTGGPEAARVRRSSPVRQGPTERSLPTGAGTGRPAAPGWPARACSCRPA